MEIEKIIEQLVTTEDSSQLLKQLIEEDLIELKKILMYIFDHIGQIKNETKIKYLAQVIAQTSFKKKCLNIINDQLNSIDNNESKQMFVRKMFIEISKSWFFLKLYVLKISVDVVYLGCLIEKSESDDFDISFVRNYARLAKTIMSWWHY